MKLTELKNSIDEALRYQSDYDVVINGLDIEGCGISPDRFNFNIEMNKYLMCEEYHIEEDDEMSYCNSCDLYHTSGKDCPGCELKINKKALLPY